MKAVAVTLAVLGCTPLPVPAPGEPPPVFTPRPVPPATVVPIPEPEPTPVPTPEPEVTMPANVKRGEPFVVRYCGPQPGQQVSIRFDGKWDAGGLMGWQDGCKRQTVTGLNTAGRRFLQFVVDGQMEPVRYDLIVE